MVGRRIGTPTTLSTVRHPSAHQFSAENWCAAGGFHVVRVDGRSAKGVPEVAQSEALDDWVNGIQPTIAGFEGYDYPDGIHLDFSAEVLPRLVEQARWSLDDPEDVLDTENRDYVLAVMAYLGEFLLQSVGGLWHWDDAAGFVERGLPTVDDPRVREEIAADYWGWPDSPQGTPPGLPVIVPDPGLGLPPLSPLHLVLAGIGPEGKDVWEQTYADWTSAAQAYRAEHPDWVPTETQTPGYGNLPTPPPSDVLDSWLQERSRGFADWAAAYPGTWDFTEESLDGLSALLIANVGSEAELASADNRELVEGAAWYYGETMRRGARRVHWIHRPDDAKPGDPQLTTFSLQCDELNTRSTPYWKFVRELQERSQSLRRLFQRWHH